jgi:hypothetical protein
MGAKSQAPGFASLAGVRADDDQRGAWGGAGHYSAPQGDQAIAFPCLPLPSRGTVAPRQRDRKMKYAAPPMQRAAQR